MKRMSLIYILFAALVISSCNIIAPDNDPVTYGESYIPNLLSTDKAAYKPGEKVTFSLNSMPEGAVTVRYTHLGKTLKQESLSSREWTWQPPAEDFQGYMAELHTTVNGRDEVISAVGIDVSSEPSRFPRNGFLSTYGDMSSSEIATVLNDLNRYHINYVQFQDWHWKHHHPLAGSATQPMDVWTDISGLAGLDLLIDGTHFVFKRVQICFWRVKLTGNSGAAFQKLVNSHVFQFH